jgi:hypothetical protein
VSLKIENKILEDFKQIEKSSNNEYTTIEFEKSNKGDLIIGTGMKSSYLGAFTRLEINFIEKIIKSKDIAMNPAILKIIHKKDETGLISKTDIHLFSGSSLIGTFRIDINPKSNATHFISVQEILKILIKNKLRFDLIILDPPYNQRYDIAYGTHDLNKIDKSDGSSFLNWLVNECLKIINPNGVIISKNWRSINPDNCKFVNGMITKYGGFRRITLLEVWEYLPNYNKEKALKTNILTKYAEENKLSKVNWFYSIKNEWVYKEIELIKKNLKNRAINKAILISDNKANPFEDLDLVIMKPEEFILQNDAFDLIILSECQKVGGSIKLTNELKKKISECINSKGIAFLKTYFYPVLEKLELTLLDEYVLIYDNCQKINLFTIYEKK